MKNHLRLSVIRDMYSKLRVMVVDDFNKQITDEDLNTITRHKNYFMAFFYQYALGAIVAGFAVQPLLKFADPFYFSLAGLILAFSIVTSYRLFVVSSVSTMINRKRLAILLFILFIANLVLCSIVMNNARNASGEHDFYCFRIQESVQQGIDSEKNSIIFNNMQCRIQY